MPSYQAEEAKEREPLDTTTADRLSAIDRACVRQLVGHTLAVVEREFILQTLRHHRGNRTRAAEWLRISIRSLRDKIRNYRKQGENVPEPEPAYTTIRAERRTADFRH